MNYQGEWGAFQSPTTHRSHASTRLRHAVGSTIMSTMFKINPPQKIAALVGEGPRVGGAGCQAAHPSVRRLLIDLDNGPEIASSRTQFMKRLVEFSDRYQLTLELAYYPPYHSKYNLIERCWGILENHWNGTLLTSIATALEWAKTMTWRGITPIVHLMDRVYETGVRILPRIFRSISTRLERSTSLPKWSLIISPESR